MVIWCFCDLNWFLEILCCHDCFILAEKFVVIVVGVVVIRLCPCMFLMCYRVVNMCYMWLCDLCSFVWLVVRWNVIGVLGWWKDLFVFAVLCWWKDWLFWVHMSITSVNQIICECDYSVSRWWFQENNWIVEVIMGMLKFSPHKRLNFQVMWSWCYDVLMSDLIFHELELNAKWTLRHVFECLIDSNCGKSMILLCFMWNISANSRIFGADMVSVSMPWLK